MARHNRWDHTATFHDPLQLKPRQRLHVTWPVGIEYVEESLAKDPELRIRPSDDDPLSVDERSNVVDDPVGFASGFEGLPRWMLVTFFNDTVAMERLTSGRAPWLSSEELASLRYDYRQIQQRWDLQFLLPPGSRMSGTELLVRSSAGLRTVPAMRPDSILTSATTYYTYHVDEPISRPALAMTFGGPRDGLLSYQTRAAVVLDPAEMTLTARDDSSADDSAPGRMEQREAWFLAPHESQPEAASTWTFILEFNFDPQDVSARLRDIMKKQLEVE